VSLAADGIRPPAPSALIIVEWLVDTPVAATIRR
jgi:hypothetical protein